jgi:FKBP-type peptidyl-prolyl cis-trans isomerase
VHVIQAGLADGILGNEAKAPLETWGPRIDGMLKSRAETVTAREREAGKTFAAEAAKGAGAEVTESGLVYVEMEPGTGASPSPTDTVQLEYKGSFRDGNVFDRSEEGGEPVTFALDGVVQCFSEGISKMKVGGTSKLVCPPDIAYGDQGYPPVIPPGATLMFEVKLIGIVSEATAPEAPPAP